jgi:hypothetical protein
MFHADDEYQLYLDIRVAVCVWQGLTFGVFAFPEIYEWSKNRFSVKFKFLAGTARNGKKHTLAHESPFWRFRNFKVVNSKCVTRTREDNL